MLSMSLSKAQHKLRRQIMFSFLVELNRDTCYRCQNKMTVDNFSIDHIQPWLGHTNDNDLFFAPDNLTFSHHSCNSRAIRRKIGVTKHGIAAYNRKGCRCAVCKKAKRLKNKQRRR